VPVLDREWKGLSTLFTGPGGDLCGFSHKNIYRWKISSSFFSLS
jgi:hypothetical protein